MGRQSRNVPFKARVQDGFRFFGILIGVGLIVYSGYNLYLVYREYSTATNSYSTLTDEYTSPAPSTTTTSTQEDASQLPPKVDFAKLQKKNPDVIGWIFSAGTKINYPVTVGRDNAYYLTHLIDGRRNSSGTIFIDRTNASDFSDDNTIMYGHHMRNGSMFASIEKYKKQSYFDEHPIMHLLTPNGNYRIEVFAGNLRDDEMLERTFGDGESKLAFLEKVRKRSTFISPVEVSETDRIVTLSTCDYSYDNARYMLFGKLVAE